MDVNTHLVALTCNLACECRRIGGEKRQPELRLRSQARIAQNILFHLQDKYKLFSFTLMICKQQYHVTFAKIELTVDVNYKPPT